MTTGILLRKIQITRRSLGGIVNFNPSAFASHVRLGIKKMIPYKIADRLDTKREPPLHSHQVNRRAGEPVGSILLDRNFWEDY